MTRLLQIWLVDLEQDVTPDRKMLVETDTNEGKMSGFFLFAFTLWDQVRSWCFLVKAL